MSLMPAKKSLKKKKNNFVEFNFIKPILIGLFWLKYIG